MVADEGGHEPTLIGVRASAFLLGARWGMSGSFTVPAMAPRRLQPAPASTVHCLINNFTQGNDMPKAYWMATYRSISNPDALAEYARLAGPAIQAAGGRFLARGLPAQVYEAAENQRAVLIEFDSVASAKAAHDSAQYQLALEALGDGAVRDIRIVEAVE